MTSSTVYPNTGRFRRPAAHRVATAPVRVAAWAAWVAWVAWALGSAGCSQSDSFLGAQIDHQLRQGETPTLDLGRVGPANWTQVCVLGPYTDDGAAAQRLGFPWPASTLTSIGGRDDRVVLAFTDGRKMLAFVERPRADGDFTRLQPPCLARAAARLTMRRDADGRWQPTVAR
jgi:hypothetical protein